MGWGKPTPFSKIRPMWINRPQPEGQFVKINILYCGISHVDVDIGSNKLGNCMYPCVPGHEAVGIVSEVGKDVTLCFPGERVGVGAIIDTCLDCHHCADGMEQYCEQGGSTMTYNTMKGKYEQFGKQSHFLGNPDIHNFGGYSGSIVVH